MISRSLLLLPWLLAGCVDLGLEIGPPLLDEVVLDDGPAAVAEAEVRLENNAFVPAEVTVLRGGTVRWTNFDQADHTVTEGQPESGLHAFNSGRFGAGGQFSHRFEDPGDVAYFCMTHPQIMRNGVVHVVEETP